MEARFIRPRDLASTKTRAGRWPVSTATLWRWVASGILPPPVKLGPQIAVWPLDVIEAHEIAQTCAPRDTAQQATAGAASVAKRKARRRVGATE